MCHGDHYSPEFSNHNHDNVPPIMQRITNANGITNMYIHQGSPSNDLSSLVKISISSFIIVSF